MVVTRGGNGNPPVVPPGLPPALPAGVVLVAPPGLPPGLLFDGGDGGNGGDGGDGGNGGDGGDGNGGGVVPPNRIIHSHPAGLDSDAAYFTYDSAREQKYFGKATEPMETKYDGSAKGLVMFITKVEQKAELFGWEPILTIPTAMMGNLSLLDNYGQITLADIKAHAVTYMNAESRHRQDSFHLKAFLGASLNDAFMMRVLAHKNQYLVGGIQHGPSLFRVILSLVGLHTKATVAVINASLRRLPMKMEEFGSDIVTFNEYVVNQCSELTARGKVAQDLVSLLFEAYNTASNDQFRTYMSQKWQNILDGTTCELTAYEVMSMAEEYYKHRMTTGEWKEDRKVEKRSSIDNLVALKAEFEAYKARITKRFSERKSNNNSKFAWKEIEPKGTEPHYKTMNGKEYVFCPNHGFTKWVLAYKHKDGCTKDPVWVFPGKGTTASINNGPTSTNDGPTNKTLQYAKALMNVVTEDDIYEYNDDDDENI
jgi:hypothetical protein